MVMAPGFLVAGENTLKYYDAMAWTGFDVEVLGWEGATDAVVMAQRLGEVACRRQGESVMDPPVVVAGFSAGAVAALLARQPVRSAGEVLINTSPWFFPDWGWFLEHYAANDQDFKDLDIANIANIPPEGYDLPDTQHPMLLFSGKAQASFMINQSRVLKNSYPNSRLHEVPHVDHPISQPKLATVLGATAWEIFELAENANKDFDSSNVEWQTEPGLEGFRYAYTGNGAAAVLEEGCETPSILNLAGLTCLATRIYNGESSPIPADDERMESRYVGCRPGYGVLPIFHGLERIDTEGTSPL